MTTATEARAVAGWLLASDCGNVATEAAGMLTDYAELLERQAMDVHSCHPNCSRYGCVNERLRGLLLWALYHAQGGSSPVGQPIRRALGIGQHEHMTAEQIRTGTDAAAHEMRPNASLSGGRMPSA